jgi:hypothetical protein
MSSKKIYNCESCDKTFETATGLWKHKKNKHSEPEIIIDKNSICKYCNKSFYDRKTRWRHEKKYCKLNTDIVNSNDPKYNHVEKANINKLAMDNSNIIDTQNNNITNNQTINIYLNGTGKENIDELNEEEIEEILNDGLNSLITLIKHLNFNDRLPENHTFCTTNLNNKYISALNEETNEVEKHRKIDFFDKVFLYALNHFDMLKDKITNKIKKKKFIEQLENIQKALYGKEHKKIYLEQINLLTYNNRKKIQETWEKIFAKAALD